MSLTIAAILLFVYVVLDAIKDSNRDHGTFDGWRYARNRWRDKYAREPYTWENQKWWAKMGLTSFIDLWHAAKTLQVLILVSFVLAAAGLSLMWTPIGWIAYGSAFTVIYNVLKEI